MIISNQKPRVDNNRTSNEDKAMLFKEVFVTSVWVLSDFKNNLKTL